MPHSVLSQPRQRPERGSSPGLTFDVQGEQTGIAPLLRRLNELGIDFRDLHSSESSLEDIFVGLVRQRDRAGGEPA